MIASRSRHCSAPRSRPRSLPTPRPAGSPCRATRPCSPPPTPCSPATSFASSSAPRGRRPSAPLHATPAASVTDLSARTRPSGRLFLFGATASAIDTTAHTITVDVNFGNWRGLFALLGQPVHQTFTYDSNTVFLKWRHGVPIGVAPSVIHAGDPLTLRVFGPVWNAPLAPAFSPRRSGGSSSASRCASPCATAPRCPPPDHHPRGPLTPHLTSRGPQAAAHPPTPAGPASPPAPRSLEGPVASSHGATVGTVAPDLPGGPEDDDGPASSAPSPR